LIVDFDNYELKKKEKISSIFSNVKIISNILVSPIDGEQTKNNFSNFGK
jgi:hypothetical protein